MSLVTSVSRYAVAGLMAAAACFDDARFPSEAARRTPGLSAMTVSTAAATTNAGAGTGRHIVSFSGAVPGDFASRVSALGGTVLWGSSASGLPVVTGLTGSAPPLLAAGKGVPAAEAEASLALGMP